MTVARRLGSLGVAAAALGFITLGGLEPARAQPPLDPTPRMLMGRVAGPIRKFEFEAPREGLTVDDRATVRWSRIQPELLDVKSPSSLTWYYATQPDGSDRQRVVTSFHQRFDEDFRDHWLPVNALRTDWAVERDGLRGARRFLRGRVHGEPLVSVEQWPDSFVVSVRIRPQPGARDFGVGARASREQNSLYALRGWAELSNPQAPEFFRQKPLPQFEPEQWYWYELGVKNTKRDVVVRGRIWDGEHARVLQTLFGRDVPGQANCPNGKRIALLGGADFAELYVDPWDVRWPSVPRQEGTLEWDTRSVPNGDYYLIAVTDKDFGRPGLRVSDFQVSVRH
jgi:hypothetical protein